MSNVSRFIVFTGVMLAISAYVCWQCNSTFIAAYGALLQVFAVAVVVRGLVGTLKVFAPDKLKQDLQLWWAQIRFWQKRPVIVGTMNASEVGLDGLQAFGTTGPLGTGRLEDQLADLQRRYQALDNVVAETRAELGALGRSVSTELERERLRSIDEIAKMRTEITEVTLANPWATILGALCLFVGLLINGGAPYLARWFGGTGCPGP